MTATPRPLGKTLGKSRIIAQIADQALDQCHSITSHAILHTEYASLDDSARTVGLIENR